MLLKDELDKLPHLAVNFDMLRTGRHINESHGRAYFEMLEHAALYETVFAAMGYTLIAGASDDQKIDFFYFDVPEVSDIKTKTSRNIVIVYAALRSHLQSMYSASAGVSTELLAIVSGKAPMEAGVVTQLTESVDMAAKLAAHQISAVDVEKIVGDMVRLGFLRRDAQRGYFFLPPSARLERACAAFEQRLHEAENADIAAATVNS